MTLSKIIYDLRERLKISSDDMDYTDEYFAHIIETHRNTLVKQRFSKFTRNVPEEVKQIICVDLTPVDSIAGEPCFGDILKSDIKMPAFLEIGGRSALVAVRVLDMLNPHINIISTERLPFVGYNKWLQKQIYIALDADGYLYLKSDNPLHLNLEQVKVIGVFSDVEAADALACDADSTCDFYDKEYAIEPYLIADLVNIIVKELSGSINLPEDKVNNSDESNRN